MDFATPELGVVPRNCGAARRRRPRLDPQGRLLFLDLEMTGLDALRHRILEVAAVLTDADLNEQDRFGVVLHQPQAALETMPFWCQRQHRAPGPDGSPSLLQQVAQSSVHEGGADQLLCLFLDQHRAQGTVFTLAGSSVDHDRQFLLRWLPRAASRLHYRVVDVSALLELQKRWMPHLRADLPRPTGGHRAMGDTLDSLALLRHYRRVLLHPDASAPAPMRLAYPESESDEASLGPSCFANPRAALPYASHGAPRDASSQ